jgi:peptidoglycan/LPS O-acetylase OafA/YrhL
MLAREPQPGLFPSYLRSLTLMATGTIDGAYWTLRVEVMFYAAIFVLLYLDWFRRIETFASALGLMSSAFWLWWIATSLHAGHFDGHDYAMRRSALLLLTLVRHGCLFALGILFWVTWIRGLSLRRAALLILFFAMSLAETASQALDWQAIWSTGGRWHDAISWTPTLLAVTAGLLAIPLSVAANTTLHRIAGRRVAAALRTLGLMTYPLYLLHDRAGLIVLNLATQAHIGRYPALALVFALFIGLSWTVVKTAEPALRWALRRALTRLEPGLQRFYRLFRPTAVFATIDP